MPHRSTAWLLSFTATGWPVWIRPVSRRKWRSSACLADPTTAQEFVRPVDAPWLDITIPVTVLDLSGLATFARYSSAEQPGRAVFAGLIRQRNQSCSECADEKD